MKNYKESFQFIFTIFSVISVAIVFFMFFSPVMKVF